MRTLTSTPTDALIIALSTGVRLQERAAVLLHPRTVVKGERDGLAASPLVNLGYGFPGSLRSIAYAVGVRTGRAAALDAPPMPDYPAVVQSGECYTDGDESVPHNVWDDGGRCATCGQRV